MKSNYICKSYKLNTGLLFCDRPLRLLLRTEVTMHLAFQERSKIQPLFSATNNNGLEPTLEIFGKKKVMMLES